MSNSTSFAETANAGADTAATLAAKARDMGTRAKAAVNEKADSFADSVRPKIDAVNDYVRNEPTKALLIAAATGAGVMALVALASRSSTSSRIANADTSDLTAALRKLAKRTPKAASDATGMANGAASDAVKEGKKRASAAADAISDTWAQLRDQAGPMVDRVRPQIDAVTAFAKDEPMKAAAGVALAGAVLAGIAALIRGQLDD